MKKEFIFDIIIKNNILFQKNIYCIKICLEPEFTDTQIQELESWGQKNIPQIMELYNGTTKEAIQNKMRLLSHIICKRKPESEKPNRKLKMEQIKKFIWERVLTEIRLDFPATTPTTLLSEKIKIKKHKINCPQAYGQINPQELNTCDYTIHKKLYYIIDSDKLGKKACKYNKIKYKIIEKLLINPETLEFQMDPHNTGKPLFIQIKYKSKNAFLEKLKKTESQSGGSHLTSIPEDDPYESKYYKYKMKYFALKDKLQ